MKTFFLQPKLVVFTILTVLVLACQYDPHGNLYTTTNPKEEDIPGTYILYRYDLPTDIIIEHNNVKLTLFPDGTFKGINIPPNTLSSPDKNFFSTLLSGDGEWKLGTIGTLGPGQKKIWGVYLRDSEDRFHSPSLTGEKAPYGLIFTLGDPDTGDAVILRKQTSK